MSGQEVLFVYLGAAGAIAIINAVQWQFFRRSAYGLFALQTFIWFAHSVFNRIVGDDTPLTESQNMALHTSSNGLAALVYLELTRRLFELPGQPSLLGAWLRRGQWVLVIALPLQVGLMLTNESWQLSAVGRSVSTLYWLYLLAMSLLGASVALRSHRLDGYFFAAGSLFVLGIINIIFYYTGYPFELPTDAQTLNLHVLVLSINKFGQLLCFSLALLFWQHQLTVAQTRRDEQLVQQQLEAELAIRKLKQEKTEFELQAIQAQVNPHFLFNCLNTLSSLIDEEPQRGIQFVDRLSQVYRYLLRANEHPLTTLSDELDFIDAYVHLLKTRYGDGFDLAIRIAKDTGTWLLPTLTLQLLVENAVKHNVTSARRPLHITIETDAAGYLTVRNNLQPKLASVLSNGVGLATLLKRYEQLLQPAPVITKDTNQFAIRLRLIESLAEPHRSIT